MDGVGISIIGRPRPLPGHDTPNALTPPLHPQMRRAAYAFNTGDTEDFMKVCQVEGYCDAFAHDLERMHTDAYLIKPLTNQYLQTNKIYECSLQKARTEGICVEFTFLQTPAVFRYLTEEKASEEYDTISTVTGEEVNNEQTLFRVLFLEERGDTWVVTHIWDH